MTEQKNPLILPLSRNFCCCAWGDTKLEGWGGMMTTKNVVVAAASAAMETTSMKFSSCIKQPLHRLDGIPTGLTHPMAALRAGRVGFCVSVRPEKRWKIAASRTYDSAGSEGRHHVRMWCGKHLGSFHTGIVSFS